MIQVAHLVRRIEEWSDPFDQIILTHENRYFRRRKLTSRMGLSFIADLAHATTLRHGDALELSDGRLIEIVAAPEPLLEVTGELARLAWHVGNRHAPCRIEADRLLVQDDPVMADMLRRLGATVRAVTEPFEPEGGAYGHGRTMAHAHGPGGHGHD